MASDFAHSDRRAEARAAIRASQERITAHRATVLRHAANLRRLVAALNGTRH